MSTQTDCEFLLGQGGRLSKLGHRLLALTNIGLGTTHRLTTARIREKGHQP
jgi:hypothetical protein